MDDEKIREIAHRRWEQEGRPEGQHDRHWREAEQEHSGTTQTMPSDHNSGVSPTSRSEGVPHGEQDVEEPSNDWPLADE
ncbi:DUF2934 domain-containing protein [Rhizobium sp. XQZ8]|uniref:DUF2934 domain-containing protein n=1 Tax=Rhizobium populisoli TaxID=2859785 RepID=UPI001C662A33|nr:DUF2934 domain-containing protein [Rhizobium populisoli]MBW6425569.1 DUF2934 domain-containing protein [Rhizobium populisoli]